MPIQERKAYGAAVAQNVREDILANAPWARAGGNEVIVISKLGLYGAVTATYGLYKGRAVISEEGTILQATTYDGDELKVPVVNLVLLPNESLRCFMTDSAADPLGIVVVVRGASYTRGR